MTGRFAELNPPIRLLLGPGPSNVDPRVMLPLRASRRALFTCGALTAVLALLLWLPNPQEDVLLQRAAVRAAIEEKVEEEAKSKAEAKPEAKIEEGHKAQAKAEEKPEKPPAEEKKEG